MRLILLDPDLADPERVARNLRFATDGRSLAAVLGNPDSGRRVVVRYDLNRDRGTVIPEPSDEDEGREDAPDPAVSPDLELVAEVLLGIDGRDCVRLTDTWAKPPEGWWLTLPDDESPTAVGFAAGGAVLLVGLAGATPATVRRYDVEALAETEDVDAAGLHPDDLDMPLGVVPASFASAADTLAVGTQGGRAVLIDLSGTRRPLVVTHGPGKHSPAVRQVLFSPDGRRLLTRAGGSVVVWDVSSGDELARLAGPHGITAAAFTPDGQGLLVSGRDGTVSRFDADGFDPAGRLDFGLGPLHSVAVAPDGLTAAAGADAGRVAVWDL